MTDDARDPDEAIDGDARPLRPFRTAGDRPFLVLPSPPAPERPEPFEDDAAAVEPSSDDGRPNA